MTNGLVEDHLYLLRYCDIHNFRPHEGTGFLSQLSELQGGATIMQDRPFGQGGASLQLLPGSRTISSSFCATTIAQNVARMNAKIMGNLIFLYYVLQSVLKEY